MNTYKLLTPGPLTTTDTVKQEMLVDRCTWDDDYKAVTQKIRRQLLELAHVSEDDYTAVLMQKYFLLWTGRQMEAINQYMEREKWQAILF